MGSRSNSIPRKSGEQMIPGITEEDEEEEEEEEDVEEEEMEFQDVVEDGLKFGPELSSAVPAAIDGDESVDVSTAPVSPLGPLTPPEKVTDPLAHANGNGTLTEAADAEDRKGSGGIPLTAEALAKNQQVVEEKEKEREKEKSATE